MKPKQDQSQDWIFKDMIEEEDGENIDNVGVLDGTISTQVNFKNL